MFGLTFVSIASATGWVECRRADRIPGYDGTGPSLVHKEIVMWALRSDTDEERGEPVGLIAGEPPLGAAFSIVDHRRGFQGYHRISNCPMGGN